MYLLLAVFLHLVYVQLTCCTIQLTINPEVVSPANTAPVTIRCSLNVFSSDIEKVYSIMIRRRGATIAVAFTDGKTKICDDRLEASAVVNSSLSTPETYLLLTLLNVTCDDIGDYTCIMAVRKKYLTMKMTGPDKVYLKMSGNSCPFIDSLVYPSHEHRLEDTVSITCFMLARTQVSGWVWTTVDDGQTIAGSKERYTLASGGKMFNCSSVLRHRISTRSSLTCRLKSFTRTVRIDVKEDATDSRAMIFWGEENEDFFQMNEFPKDHTQAPVVCWYWAPVLVLCVLTAGGLLFKYRKTIGNASKQDNSRKAYNMLSNCPETEHKLMTENTGSSQTSEDIT